MSCQTPVTRNQKTIIFDFENLSVFQKAVKFINEIFQIVKDLPKEYRYAIVDNLLRAALSIANNLAEGNDKPSLKEKARYFRTSSDSARECVAVLIVLNEQKLISENNYWKLKSDLREITSMIRAIIK